jgi:hypothetical protein
VSVARTVLHVSSFIEGEKSKVLSGGRRRKFCFFTASHAITFSVIFSAKYFVHTSVLFENVSETGLLHVDTV